MCEYPRTEAVSTSEYYLARFQFAFTRPVPIQVLPEEIPEPPSPFEVVDAWLPPDGTVSPVAGEFELADASSFRGVSGGGCWKMDVANDPRSWKRNTKPTLSATHVSTIVTGDDTDDVLRQVPVAYHPRMIADDYPDLPPRICERWSGLAEVPPADSFR